MLGTFILGIVAGFAAPYAEPHVKTAIEGALLSDASLSAVELRLFAFALCLLAAAVLASVLGDGGALAIALGAAVGVFAPRVLERIQQRRDG